MRASARPRADATITLADGRALAYCEWGNPTGFPVLWMHGGPGSRLLCPDEDATAAAGVRLLTVDRPGYGGSDPRPDPSLLGWADDVKVLADRLSLERFAVVGWRRLCAGLRCPDAGADQHGWSGLLRGSL